MIKRLRIFAGPNGSGKSTFIRNFPTTSQRNLGVYVNADEIEEVLRDTRQHSISQFEIEADTDDIQAHFRQSSFSPIKLNNPNLWKHFHIENGVLKINSLLEINSYIAADLAEFIRQKLVKSGVSFSFETVMSDFQKVDFLNHAKAFGYQVYLYYFCTEDPEININRVSLRVAQSGHNVGVERIRNRYFKSLENLKPAMMIAHRSYIFDNSSTFAILIAEVDPERNVHVIDPEQSPNWFVKYVVRRVLI